MLTQVTIWPAHQICSMFLHQTISNNEVEATGALLQLFNGKQCFIPRMNEICGLIWLTILTIKLGSIGHIFFVHCSRPFV